MSLLPIKTKVKGPAPVGKEGEDDIIDEAIRFFRANVLFASFEIKGGADRLLVYLTLFLNQCIVRLAAKAKNKKEGEKIMFDISKETFPLPGEDGWKLGGHFPSAKTRAEAEDARNYLKQVREEAATRILNRVFDDQGNPNKHWMAFSKRKFMVCFHFLHFFLLFLLLNLF